jgi:hypothetical protein
MKAILVVLVLACVSIASAQAQTAPPATSGGAATSAQTTAPVQNPVSSVLRTLLPRQQKNILAAIDAMPADKFSYKPTPEQISFAHLVVHITQSNNALCSKVADIAAPKVAELKDTDSKDTLLAAARASFDFCGTALANVDDSKLGDHVDFGFAQGPRATADIFLASGWADHYAAAAMYLRLNGILPPTAQPKK